MSAESPASPAVSPAAPAGSRPPWPAGAKPLAMRLRPGQWVALDYVTAALCAVIIFGVMYTAPRPHRFPITALYANEWLPVLMALGLAAPTAIRRRNPPRALGMILVASVATIALGGEFTRALFLPLALVLYPVAVTSRRAVAVPALAASVAVMAVQGLILHFRGLSSGNAVGASLVMIICWMVGYVVRQQRAYTAHLRNQAASTAVTEERLRIARELHDVVAHSMTVVTVQAGFGEYVFDSQPGEARAALGAIQTVGREALSDMQQLLGVLRHAAEPGVDAGHADLAASLLPPGHGSWAANGGGTRAVAPLAPAPGLADLDRLVARTAGAGVKVTVERTGRVRGLPAGIDLSAYRIVQEALTNVVKHSGADDCHVVIGYGDGDLSVEITDVGARAVAGAGGSRAGAPLSLCSGHGLTGMRERVSLCGGEFSAAPLPDQGFRVAARLPLTSGAP